MFEGADKTRHCRSALAEHLVVRNGFTGSAQQLSSAIKFLLL